LPRPAGSEAFIWVDEAGVTHLTDDPARVPEAALQQAADAPVDAIRSLWKDGILGPVPRTPPGSSGSESDRVLRLLRGAVEDLRRGETARAAATLRSVRRIDPRRPETYWYLALLDRQRGRYESAARNLQRFLELAGDGLASWKSSARRRLEALDDERRLADTSVPQDLRLLRTSNAHFRIALDAELNEVSSQYASTVMSYLEEARRDVSAQIGVEPLEPLGVVFYSKAAYVQAHRHRFSFQTVGFFDGRIHVTSPAHPSGALRSLLYHEYTHAVFREQTGGDRPYWLNEGLAERIERGSRRLPATTRSERASLRTRIEAGLWIPLSRLAPSFSGLTDEQARAAYLQSVLAVSWLEQHTTPEQRARLIGRLGGGFSVDQALHEATGLDTDGLDTELQREIRAEFPSLSSASRIGTRPGRGK
jgi:tetratricopeptide (TPR) repeat protein